MHKLHKHAQILREKIQNIDIVDIKKKLMPWKEAVIAAVAVVVLWHAIMPHGKTPATKMAVADLQDITQTFIGYLANQNLDDEQSSQWLHVFSKTLQDEIDSLSKTHILLASNQVVSELDDYTPEIKTRISQAIAKHVSRQEKPQ